MADKSSKQSPLPNGIWRPYSTKSASVTFWRRLLLLLGCSATLACDGVPSEDDEAIAAARNSVTAAFENADGVEFTELTIGNSSVPPPPIPRLPRRLRRLDGVVVCGIVDGEELTRPSRFVFVHRAPDDGSSEPPADSSAGDEALRMEYPPRINGHNQTEEGYWEALLPEMEPFLERWLAHCPSAGE